MRAHAVLIPALGLLAVVAACAQPAAAPVPTGREDFAVYCSACHGDGGRGDGALADTLDRRPADLTGLAARNGGTFPMTKVMAKIWGYTRGQTGGAVMPSFGPLLDSETVLFDSGDGISTPTPLRLVQLAEYVQTLQQ
jgi:mono/diheme cytochrome c family protein